MKHLALSAVAAAVMLQPAVSLAGYNFTTGAEYTSGDYGTNVTTDTWYVPFIFGYTGNDYALSVTVPFISVSGSTEVTGVSSSSMPGKGGVKASSSTSTTTDTRTDSGLGDVILKGSYQLQTETPQRPWLGITGKIKLGTASRKDNLGTGETDYAVQLDVARGPLDGFVGYQLIGDTSTVNYDDIFYGAIGYSMPINPQWRMRAEFYAEQAAASGADPVQEVTVAFLKPLSKTQSLKLYVLTGLTDSSPDWGAGAMVSTAF